MKKKLVAIMLAAALSVSMGAEAGAMALENGFTAEQTVEQISEPVQEAEENLTETPEETQSISEDSQQELISQEETVQDAADAEGFFEDGFMSEDTLTQEDPADVFTDGSSEVPELAETAAADGVFLWSDWEQTTDGNFRLPKKQDPSEEDAPADMADLYYTKADGIVKITTKTQSGENRTGYYLFDENGYMLTGDQVLLDEAQGKENTYCFTDSARAVAYSGQGSSYTPYNSTLGQRMTDCWIWDKEQGAFHYYDKNGVSARFDEKKITKINGERYCLKANGVPRTGNVSITENGQTETYYFSPKKDDEGIFGKMFYGWRVQTQDGKARWLYYQKSGKLKKHGTILTKLGGRKGEGTYMIDKYGYIQRKEIAKIESGSWYATDSKGRIIKDRFAEKNGNKYYFGSNGKRVTWTNGWHRCKGYANRYYYFGNSEGKVVKKTGWQKVENSSGKFVGWFFFNQNGNHYIDKLKDDYYFRPDGRIASGMTEINGKTYFYGISTSSNRNGKLVKNKIFAYRGKKYYAYPSGALRKNGWQKYDGYWYYFKNMTAVTDSYEKKNGKYGYLDKQGRYTTGWVVVNDDQNLVKYINPDKPGFVKNESKWINGKLYYFNSSGYRMNDVTSKYSGPYTLEVDRVNGVMTVYADSNRTIPVKSIRVSVGYSWTPTPTGSYWLERYSRWQSLMGPSWGQYGTHVEGAGQGGIFVHSIACGSPNSYNLPAGEYNKLGNPASHGCIRCCVADAKWVYDNCNGARIHIFDGNYKSQEVFKGPLGRRPLVPLRGSMNFDPTDPAV